MNVSNDGKPWDNLDIDQLDLMWELGVPLEKMCEELGRTGSAVASQLGKMEKIFYRMADNSYYPCTPWMSIPDVAKVNRKLP